MPVKNFDTLVTIGTVHDCKYGCLNKKKFKELFLICPSFEGGHRRFLMWVITFYVVLLTLIQLFIILL